MNAFMNQIDDIAGGIVRHAGNAAMRNDIDWDTIRAGLLALADHPSGQAALKTALKRINDPDVPAVLADWFEQLWYSLYGEHASRSQPARSFLA